MPDDDLFDFLLFNELLFPEEEDRTYECPHCGRVIEGSEEVEWIDKKRETFKCPGCGKELEIE